MSKLGGLPARELRGSVRSFAAFLPGTTDHNSRQAEQRINGGCVEACMDLKKILCAVDFSEHSLAAFQVASRLAHFFNADLRLLHVIEANLAPSNLMPVKTLNAQIMSVEEKAMRALEALIGEWGTGLQEDQILAEVTTGHASTEIINYADVHEMDLAVIGAKGIKLLEEAVIGGTAQTVVRDAKCSVLVVRN